jgi:hypothetical protein
MQSSGFSARNRLSFQRSRKKNLYKLWAPPTFTTLPLREEDKRTTTIAEQLVKSEKQLATTTASLLPFPTCDCCFCNVRHSSLSMPRIVARCCNNCADLSDKASPARATVTRWVLTQPETARAAPRHGNCTAINSQPRFPPPTALWLGWPETAGAAARPLA